MSAPQLDFLISIGTENVPHWGGASYLAHLMGTRSLLLKLGCDDNVACAGLFHSVYGTEAFRPPGPVVTRLKIFSLCGEVAEKLVYLNCSMTRASLDLSLRNNDTKIVNRFFGTETEIDGSFFYDLCLIHLADYLEQAPRMNEASRSVRRENYHAIATRFDALKTYNSIMDSLK